ncbi:molybdopterin-dependent oxidoreductase [Hymenobacter defluvii]|uniref:Molybdopterin-dependent oxidoreductase n=1 Tax=Hymenobacter defluvii TaxID=2054411 RepID=A0ABS3TC60_9BACT|nr:molybdopterin-dependent oxidoreductase [Hymenobacter defluvii]MBO3271251.1 molybdopterin-dependent oxidoreductase [Hymenobacter defluvii]
MTAPQRPTPTPNDEAVEQEAARRSRRAFLTAGLASLAALGGWRWLATRPTDDGALWPLRRVLDVNGKISKEFLSNADLAPVFPRSRAKEPRINGSLGLKSPLDTTAWQLQVQGLRADGPAPVRTFSLADIQALPRVEMTTELKCIEGWSVVVNWAGARFSDFVTHYQLASAADLAPYVHLVTPDQKYYVGMDMQSALHPQTLLCYEMNGQPLTLEHGAPLRLVTPLKYGIKHIKRIGSIAFTAQRPADYWAQRGYDWYSGL